MITNEQKRMIIDNMIEVLDLPDSAYDKARSRYEDLGDWFDRDESVVSGNKPHIFPQGSFRLGTAIRPIDDSEEYDLDLACKLRDGINKENHTQESLKQLIGAELEAYRRKRNIKKELEEKHRCWRLEYQDDLSFHMDIVPCIPADENRIQALKEVLEHSRLEKIASVDSSRTTINITDDRSPSYSSISSEWNISNPEGYARWFEEQMEVREGVFVAHKEAKAQVDDVPRFNNKTPLQRVVQLLKRHRDNWSKPNPEAKPISIIITTLAARAYNGEADIVVALRNVLGKMGDLVNPAKPRVPNPVDPDEDFADRWYRANCLHLRLEENFNVWLLQARKDFEHITSTTDTKYICDNLENKFSLNINESKLKEQLGISVATVNVMAPETHVIDPHESAKPWHRDK